MSRRIITRLEDSGIAYLKMNDSEKNNTFSHDFIAELIEGVDKITEMKPKVNR